MTVSKFLNTKPLKVAAPKEQQLKRSNFAGGIDTLTSPEEMGPNTTPYARNVRNVHQGSIGMKKGPGVYTVPQGQTTDNTHVVITAPTDTVISTTNWVATSFIAGGTKSLSRIDLRIKSATVAGTAPIIVELWSDNAGKPGTFIASSSISSAAVTTSYQNLPCYFIEGPALLTGSVNWIVVYQQNNGAGQYNWSASTTYTGGLTSTNSGVAWASTNGLNFTTYLATTGGTLGATRVRFSNGNKYDVYAFKEAGGTTGVYWSAPGTGVLTVIKTGLSGSATDYQFFFTNDLLVYVNNVDNPRQWNGSTDTSVIFPGGFLSSTVMGVINHKNRWFFLESDTNRVVYSEAGDITTYLSTNFLYVPAPKTGTPVTSMWRLQDNLWFGTRKSKYVLYGSDATSFILRQSLATKGVINQNAVTVDGNFAYFVSDDGLYTCNGSTDTIISRFITPTFNSIPDLSKGQLVIWNNNLRWYFAEAGSASCNAMLTLDLINGGWFYDTNAYVQRVFKYQTPGDALSLIECSSTVGAAYFAEQQYSDLGKPIKMEYFDIPQFMGDPGVYKQILFYYVRFVAESGSYLVNCQMDKELQNAPADGFVQMQGGGPIWGTVVWGQFRWGTSNFIESTIPVNGEYRYWQPRITITGADCPIEFVGYTMYYLTQQPR